MVGRYAIVTSVKEDEYEVSLDSQIWSALPAENLKVSSDTISCDILFDYRHC